MSFWFLFLIEKEWTRPCHICHWRPDNIHNLALKHFQHKFWSHSCLRLMSTIFHFLAWRQGILYMWMCWLLHYQKSLIHKNYWTIWNLWPRIKAASSFLMYCCSKQVSTITILWFLVSSPWCLQLHCLEFEKVFHKGKNISQWFTINMLLYDQWVLGVLGVATEFTWTFKEN